MADHDGLVPCSLQSEESSKEYSRNWARLIQKIYEIDPMTCPKCHGPMAVIAFIEAEDVIEKILKHLGLWELTPRPPPRIAKAQPTYTSPERLRPRESCGPQHDVPSLSLTHKARIPYIPSQ